MRKGILRGLDRKGNKTIINRNYAIWQETERLRKKYHSKSEMKRVETQKENREKIP